MPIKGTIQYKRDPEVLKKHFRPFVKDANKNAARHWHTKLLPKHFTTEGGKKYQYRKRSKKHMKAKAKLAGHQRPLVFSGDMERQSKQNVRATSTGKSGRVRFKAPWYAKKQFRGNPSYESEMTVLAEDEIKAMAEILHDDIAEAMQDFDPPPRKKRATR